VTKRESNILKKMHSVRFIIFGMAILEFSTYSVHQLLHHTFNLYQSQDIPLPEDLTQAQRLLS
jgi:hypothetical protein